MTLDWSDLIGKPFSINGRGPDSYDCYGLCLEVYRRLGIILPDYSVNKDSNDLRRRIIGLHTNEFCKIEGPKPHCLIALRVNTRFVTHIGILLPSMYQFLHCIQHKGVLVERIDSLIWSRKIAGYYEYNN